LNIFDLSGADINNEGLRVISYLTNIQVLVVSMKMDVLGMKNVVKMHHRMDI